MQGARTTKSSAVAGERAVPLANGGHWSTIPAIMAKKKTKRASGKKRVRRGSKARSNEKLPKDAVTLAVILRPRDGQDMMLEAELRSDRAYAKRRGVPALRPASVNRGAWRVPAARNLGDPRAPHHAHENRSLSAVECAEGCVAGVARSWVLEANRLDPEVKKVIQRVESPCHLILIPAKGLVGLRHSNYGQCSPVAQRDFDAFDDVVATGEVEWNASERSAHLEAREASGAGGGFAGLQNFAAQAATRPIRMNEESADFCGVSRGI